jgi:hypothetical protein
MRAAAKEAVLIFNGILDKPSVGEGPWVLTGMDLKWFCVFDYVILLPTYLLSIRKNLYNFFGLGSKKDTDFFARAKR